MFGASAVECPGALGYGTAGRDDIVNEQNAMIGEIGLLVDGEGSAHVVLSILGVVEAALCAGRPDSFECCG